MATRRGKKQARRSGGSAATPGWVWLLIGIMISAVVGVAIYFKLSQPVSNLPKPNPSAHAPKSTSSAVAPEGTAPDAAKSVPQKTKFDFYTLLPEKEVIIPDEELSARVKAEAAAQAASKAQAALPTGSAESPAGATPSTDNSPTTIAANAGTQTTSGASTGVANDSNAMAANAAAGANPDLAGTAASSGRYLLQAGAFRNAAEADNLKARIALLGLVGRVEIVQTPNGPMHRVRLGPYATASELEQAKQKLGSGGLPAVAIRVK